MIIVSLHKSRVERRNTQVAEDGEQITAAYSLSALAKVKKTRGGVDHISLMFAIIMGTR
jgi:hypothetical protein